MIPLEFACEKAETELEAPAGPNHDPELGERTRHDAGPAAPLDLTLGVETHRVEPFSEVLVRSLRASGAFARVDRIDRFARPPDLVARVEHGWQANAAIPFFTVLSLGLVPTVVDETFGLAFTIRTPGSDSAGIAIDTRWSGKTWFGIVSAWLNVSQGRTSDDWRMHPRWVAHLRHATGRHSAEIEALVARSHPTPPPVASKSFP